ncbi:MAG TPA: HEAT repeat domain-containing protein [Planctomycetaceae bacterium]|jgi:HEAT repeat protein|nr:HEAT repeat domain-containing protein [Planctomycetaceae bacterium]
MNAIQRSSEHRAELYHRNFVDFNRKRYLGHVIAKGRDAEYFRLRHWHELLREMAARILEAGFDRSDELFDAVVALRDWSKTPSALDPLCALLVDKDDEIRVWAFRVLTKLIVAADDERLIARLWPNVVKGLTDSVMKIQGLTITSLGFSPNDPVSPDPLESALCGLHATDASVRRTAIRVLPELGRESVLVSRHLILPLIHDVDPSVRLKTCEVLGWLEFDARSAIPELVKVVAQDSDLQVCCAAFAALTKIDPQAANIDVGPDDDKLRFDFLVGLLDVGEPATIFRQRLETRWEQDKRPPLACQLVPPQLRDHWGLFSPEERELLRMAWLHRRVDGLPTTRLREILGMGSDSKSKKLFDTRLAQIRKKLKSKRQELPLKRPKDKPGLIFWQ